MSDTRRTNTLTLAAAMDALARDIQSEDGVANAAIAEAAQRLHDLERENAALRAALYVIAYNDAKPCEDAPEEIACKALEERADYSGFLPNAELTDANRTEK